MSNPTYSPRGRVAILVDRMRQRPTRIYTSAECAQIMECKQAAVSATVEYALKAKLIYMRRVGRCCEYSLQPLEGAVELPPAKRRTKHPEKAVPLSQGWATDPDDPRIGKVVPGWKPPQMVCVRGA